MRRKVIKCVMELAHLSVPHSVDDSSILCTGIGSDWKKIIQFSKKSKLVGQEQQTFLGVSKKYFTSVRPDFWEISVLTARFTKKFSCEVLCSSSFGNKTIKTSIHWISYSGGLGSIFSRFPSSRPSVCHARVTKNLSVVARSTKESSIYQTRIQTHFTLPS